ncbi:PEP/pyruvate-binding domain-containing protein [Pseudonocardia spinosispora]|uniref:PEP/pyruvate-binding domain-containing protein n=1 Tax=Pseudonocardia spinosispora TaxID=103441 RepID=UPI001FDFDBEE|nr:PEP/pyruvate-binding domain-containing protein [Pseudonocardia spinosispora]
MTNPTTATTSDQAIPLVRRLDDPAADLAQVGGKGASLARLATAGLPVPPGFHVTTQAYRRFVTETGLQDRILAAVARVDATDAATLDRAAETIAALFTEHEMPPDTAEAIIESYRALGSNDIAVAVRSSATAEDLPDLSFAGQQDSYLNIRGVPALLDAVRRCWASLWTARAIGYRARTGIAPGEVDLAVVVQELVPADAAGILFTANPMTGARDQIVINAGWGLGEAVVGGQVTPDTVVIDRADGSVAERQVSDKTTMTVRTATGTEEVAVPREQRNRPVLSDQDATALAELGERIEALYETPMDIEWTRHDGRFFIVQARPVTTLTDARPLPEHDGADAGHQVWNDSLCGDYLWTSTNVGEAVPDVMTPCTWSLLQVFLGASMPMADLAGHRLSGNIGGRLYLNLSVLYSMADAFFLGERAKSGTSQAFGTIPPNLTIPKLPLSRWQIVRQSAGTVIRARKEIAANQKSFHSVVPGIPARCAELNARIAGTSDRRELAALWRDEVAPLFHMASAMLGAGARGGGGTLAYSSKDLHGLVSDEDINLLMSGGRPGGGALDSLGPVLGLARLARGDIDRDTFTAQWGHRGPHELEVSIPRPAEDPNWIDRELAALAEAKEGSRQDAMALLDQQEQARAQAWERVRAADPKVAERLEAKLDSWSSVARDREKARSEAVRVFWLLRNWVLRAGELTGHGDDLFFLSTEEILSLLTGADETSVLEPVAVRRATHDRYARLPPYPTYLRGHFDPFAWAGSAERRNDYFDATEPVSDVPVSETIKGFAGARGVVEGVARVLTSAGQGEQLRPGEILVTTVTNIGWTPLFPRAGAVVTDVGAPLSHAAIVARELGIPAVVGCGNATMRVHSGDRIRVDGSRGTVELLRE